MSHHFQCEAFPQRSSKPWTINSGLDVKGSKSSASFHSFELCLRSSVEEHVASNHEVVGANPTGGAIFLNAHVAQR
jgi:hypothetical protein